MAKPKKNGNGKKQGVVSWIINVMALGIALADPIKRAVQVMQPGATSTPFETWANYMIMDFTGWNTWSSEWKAENLAAGWAPVAGAYVFKTGMSVVMKKIKIKSIIPSLT